jgi:hypothetical protein
MQEFRLAHSMVASHKQCALAHSRSSKNQQMQPLSQQMSQHAVSTLMGSHSLYTLMFHKITRITSTAQAAQLVLENQVPS